MDFYMFAQVFGGIGFFLLGMSLMTDGLKEVAGDSLRKALQRFTKGPVSGAIIGAVVTAIVQSSSATTLATIGFVSAGLLPFVNAIGLIFGANIGTTTTGWMVSLLGLKFSISSFALPMVGVGSMLHLFGKGKLKPLGFVLAGFGLLFVAVSTLQAGMGQLAETIDFSAFGESGLISRLVLVMVGLVMTIILQSSTVALVMTMAALNAGSIDLMLAAALVVGQNVGTSFTALIVSIGAGIPAKRTAMAHVLFNVITAVIAFAALSPFVHVVELFAESIGFQDDVVALAAFHSAFSLMGILVILPFTRQFTRLIERIVPDRSGSKLAGLDASSAEIPAVALEASKNALDELLGRTLRLVNGRLHARESAESVEAIRSDILEVRAFFSKIATRPADQALHTRHVMLLRVADHIEHLLELFGAPNLRAEKENEVQSLRAMLVSLIERCEEVLRTADHTFEVSDLEARAEEIAAKRRELRREILSRFAAHEITSERTDHVLEDIGWMDGLAYHSVRATFYMESAP